MVMSLPTVALNYHHKISSMDHKLIIDRLSSMGRAVGSSCHQALSGQAGEKMSNISHKSRTDVIYEIDRLAEEIIVRQINNDAAELGGVVLIAEGIGENDMSVYPKGINADDAALRILMDPIDGTRGLMYDKRSAFFLAGAAVNKGSQTSLQDIECAVICEIPTSKALYSDCLTAIRGQGVFARRRNILTEEQEPLTVKPSKANSIRGGFAQISRFFSPGREILAKIEEELLETLFPDASDGEILSFEDQYISTGGQIYEMLMGHDRFTADIRHGLYQAYEKETGRTGHICHPYDLAGLLVAEEAGLIVRTLENTPPDYAFDTTVAADWIAYANEDIYKEVEAVFSKILKKWQII